MSISTRINNTTFFSNNQLSFDFGILQRPNNNIVRIIDDFVDSSSWDFLFSTYKFNTPRGGRKPFDPLQMLKIVLLATIENLSCRDLEKTIPVNDNYKWFARHFSSYPKKSTIANFYNIISPFIDDIFYNFNKKLEAENLIDHSVSFVDGTTMGANNNKYNGISQRRISENIIKINNDSSLSVSEKESLLQVQTKHLEFLEDYKSRGFKDIDSIGLMDKLKYFIYGYNVQLYTELKYGFICSNYVSTNGHDYPAFLPSLDKHLSRNPKPNKIVADQGFAGEELLFSLLKLRITPIIKYKRKTEKYENIDFKIINKKTVFCPENRILEYKRKNNQKTLSGYRRKLFEYRSSDCSGCSQADKCLKTQKNKELQFSLLDYALRKKSQKIFENQENVNLYKQRMHKSETANAIIKEILGRRKFRRKGITRVQEEMTLICLAHNIIRYSNLRQKKSEKE